MWAGWWESAQAAAPTLATTAWHLRPLHPVVVVWLLLLLWRTPRARAPLAVLGVAALARILVFEPRVFMHFDRSYATYALARGNLDPHPVYGDGFASALGLWWPLLGGPGDHAHAVDAVFAALTAPWVWLGALRATGDARAAWAAGLGIALLPMPVWMASTETPYVWIGLLHAVLLATARGPRADRWLAAVSAGLLAHARPTQIVVAGVAWVALAWGTLRLRSGRSAPEPAEVGGVEPAVDEARAGSWVDLGPLVLGAGLICWRVVELVAALRSGAAGGDAMSARTLSLWLHPGTWAGPGAHVQALDPWVTPAGVALLAVWGGVRAVRERRGGLALAAALFVVQTALYGHQPLRNDLDRFMLPTAAPLVIFAAYGAVAVVGRWRWLMWAGVAASWLVAARPLEPWPVWVEQHRFLIAHLHAVPEGRVVRFSDRGDEEGYFFHWINRRADAFWKPAEGPPQPGELRFVGWADRLPGAPALPWDRMTAIAEITAPAETRGVLDIGEAPVRIGIYRVVAPP